MTLRLRYAVRSHVGHIREGNEDSAYAGSRLAIVADGMGGHAAGEVASSAAISALAHLDEDEASVDLLDALAAAVQEANEQLRDMVEAEPELDGMGTTLTVMLASGSRLGVAHVGDSRAYLLRDGELTLVTHDQTLVQRMVDEGRITLDQAERHPQRALLTQALDGRDGVEPDLSLREARRGDRYLLCTDGLSGVVHEETMAESLALPDADAAAERLIELALKGGGPDNITVVVVDVVDDAAGLSDTPMVAGAAAEKDAVPGATRLGMGSPSGLASAAEKARKLLPSRRRGASSPIGADRPGEHQESTRPGADDAGHGNDDRALDSAEDGDVTGVHRMPDQAGPARPGPVADGAPAAAPSTSGGPVPATLVDAEPLREPPAARRSASTRTRSQRRRMLVILIVLVAVLAVLAGAWGFTRTQWYVAEQDGRVTLFQGVKARPFGISLSSVDQRFFPLSCLSQVNQGQIRSGYVGKSRRDALNYVSNLRSMPLPIPPAPPRKPGAPPAPSRASIAPTAPPGCPSAA